MLSGHNDENKTGRKFNWQNILPEKKFPIYGIFGNTKTEVEKFAPQNCCEKPQWYCCTVL